MRLNYLGSISGAERESACAKLSGIAGDVDSVELPSSDTGISAGPVLDTGVIGVQANIEFRKAGDRIRIRVRQKLASGEVKVVIGTRALSLITQEWLDRRLCEAAALRWHVQNVSLFGLPEKPLKVADIPKGIIPILPRKPLPLSDVFSYVDSVSRHGRQA